jgi:hypothetical protein
LLWWVCAASINAHKLLPQLWKGEKVLFGGCGRPLLAVNFVQLPKAASCCNNDDGGEEAKIGIWSRTMSDDRQQLTPLQLAKLIARLREQGFRGGGTLRASWADW